MKGKYPCNPILIVYDEINNLNSVEMALNMEKISNIVTCNDSRQVDQLLIKQQFSIVLLDLSMPFVPEEKILQLLNNQYSDIPVIIVTGNQDIVHTLPNRENKVRDYLIKPVTLTQLVSSVKRALRLSEIRELNTLENDYPLS